MYIYLLCRYHIILQLTKPFLWYFYFHYSAAFFVVLHKDIGRWQDSIHYHYYCILYIYGLGEKVVFLVFRKILQGSGVAVVAVGDVVYKYLTIMTSYCFTLFCKNNNVSTRVKEKGKLNIEKRELRWSQTLNQNAIQTFSITLSYENKVEEDDHEKTQHMTTNMYSELEEKLIKLL